MTGRVVVAPALAILVAVGCGSSPEPIATPPSTIGPTAPADELHVVRSPTPPSVEPGPIQIHIVSEPRLTPRKLPITTWMPLVDQPNAGVATHHVLRAGHRDLISFRWSSGPSTITAGYRSECRLRVDPAPWTIVRIVVHVPSDGPCSIEELPPRPLPASSAP
jgi:hypothetical protein